MSYHEKPLAVIIKSATRGIQSIAQSSGLALEPVHLPFSGVNVTDLSVQDG